MSRLWDNIFNRISGKDRTFFLRQLAIMIGGGIPIAQALTLISQQAIGENLRSVIRIMVGDIEHGLPLSTAAARFPELFDDIMVAMIKSGEVSGRLQEVLKEIADHAETQLSLSGKIRNALIYPAFIIVVMIIVAIIMTTVVIPKLNEVFVSSGLELPVTTRILVAVSNAFIHYWYAFILVAIALVVILRAYLTTPEGKVVVYKVQSKIPVVKDLLLNSYLVRFTSVMAMLTRSGVSITETLRIVSETMVNPQWLTAVQLVRGEVERGIPLSAALSRHPIFPATLIQMIGVGEQTGNLDAVLDTMTTFYQEQTDSTIKALTSLIEPVVLLIVALGVAFVVISVILPIYGLANQI